jgi:hypothetical protein
MGVKLGFSSRGKNVRVCEDRVLRKILGARLEDIRGNWRRLHSQVLHYS